MDNNINNETILYKESSRLMIMDVGNSVINILILPSKQTRAKKKSHFAPDAVTAAWLYKSFKEKLIQ